MLQKKTKTPKGLLTNAIWNILAVISAAVAGFIIVPIILKSIGTENFGIYAIILMIGSFAALQSLGLGEATLKYVSEYYSKNDLIGINRVIGSTLAVYSVSGIFISGLIILFSSDIIGMFKISIINLENATEALRIAGVAFMLSIFSGALRTIPEATQRYDVLNKYQLLMILLKYTVMYFIAVNGGGIIELTYLVLFSGIMDIIAYFVIAKYLIPGIKCYPSFRKKGIREVFGYGIFSFINDLIQKASLYADQLILGVFFSSASVAYLTAPKDLITKGQGLVGAAGQALFPRFSSMPEDEKMKSLYIESLWILTMLSMIVFVPLSIIIPAFLAKWLSPEFSANSSSFAKLYSLGIAFNGGVTVYFALLKGTGRIKWLTKIITILTILAAITTVILVYYFGLIGSGIRVLSFAWVGTSLCLFIGNKVFKDFPLRRVISETTIIPISISLIIYFIGNRILVNYILISWIDIILSYLIFLIIILIFQILANWLIYRNKGIGYLVINNIKNKIVKSNLL